MAHETGKGQPAIGLDDHGISTAAEQMHLRRPCLKRHGGIVKGRGTRAQHRHHAALECGEINRIRAMGALIRRQRTQEIGHPPFANAFLPCRQHNLARQIRPGRAFHAQAGQPIICARRRNAPGLHAISHRQGQHPAQPIQVILPGFAGYHAHGSEMRRAELRLMPGLIRQRRDAQIRPVLILPRSQGRHAGVCDPRAFLTLRRAVQQ